MAKRRSPTQRVVKRDTPIADHASSLMREGRTPDPLSAGGATLDVLIKGLMDLLSPKTEPQDVELPNPEGWAGMDERLKEHIFPGWNTPRQPRRQR